MGMRVIESRLDASPSADGTGVDRCAIGEFVGPDGELASYAFGWCTCGEDEAAWISVGIGVGNPDGGTFHAEIEDSIEGLGFALVDEPIQDVPQGGPHLSAAEARAHPDLPFIWAVADCVLARDRRAWWMRHWLRGTPCMVTTQVAGGLEPALTVEVGADGEWRLSGSTRSDVQYVPAHLHHLIETDPTMLDVLDLKENEIASRIGVESAWRRPRRRLRRGGLVGRG